MSDEWAALEAKVSAIIAEAVAEAYASGWRDAIDAATLIDQSLVSTVTPRVVAAIRALISPKPKP